MREIDSVDGLHATKRVEMNSNVAMTKNEEKKEIERRVLDAARKAGAPIPYSELAGEGPDFKFHTSSGVLGIEISEVLRPASSNDGILPAEAEAFHQSIMFAAQETYQKTDAAPAQVSVYFSRARGKKQDKRQLIKSLVECVAANRDRANPAVVLEGNELPEGFDHILITADEPGEWSCGECGGAGVRGAGSGRERGAGASGRVRGGPILPGGLKPSPDRRQGGITLVLGQ
jgi:hypothetical protein